MFVLTTHVTDVPSNHAITTITSFTFSCTSPNIVLYDNVQCDKKCNLLVQCNIKIVPYDSML